MSSIRTSLLVSVCLGNVLGAATLEHPLYFEERSNGSFETRSAGRSVTIRTDRLELDGVTLRFVHPSKRAHLEGVGPSAPTTYITRDQTLTFRAFPQAQNSGSVPESIDAVFYMDTRDILNTIWILRVTLRRILSASASVARAASGWMKKVTSSSVPDRARCGSLRRACSKPTMASGGK